MQIVGINGFKRSGKGTVANILADQTDGVVYQIGFADKLKRLAALTLGIQGTPQELIAAMDEAKINWVADLRNEAAPTTNMEKFKEVTLREFLQNLGTEARGLFGDYFWVDQVLPSQHQMMSQGVVLADLYPDVDVIAITDVRFENEAQRVRELGGVVWEVQRPGLESDGHASEQVLPRQVIDWEVHNTGTLEDLAEAVTQAITYTLLVDPS